MRIITVKLDDNPFWTEWGDQYLETLKSMCDRHVPHNEFLCITDRPEVPIPGVEYVDRICDLPGWWHKVGLFRPGCFPGDNMFLDLDVIITSSLQPLIDEYETDRSQIWMRDDFSYSLLNPKQGLDAGMQRLLGGPGTLQSSVMLWNSSQLYGGAAHRIWERFEYAKMDEVHGDQNWITQAMWPDHASMLPPEMIGSFKYGHGEMAPVVVFHGSPKPHEVIRDGTWMKEHWR